MREMHSFGAVGSGGDFVAFDFEQINQKVQYAMIIIDDKDSASV
jgi:hypothetical protein